MVARSQPKSTLHGAHTEAEPAAAFTAGPWVAKMQFGEWFVRQDPKPWDGNGYQLVCNLPAAKKGSYSGDMFAANARLIAAAPDLLANEMKNLATLEETRRRLQRYGKSHAELDTAIEQTRDAIAKATGQSTTPKGA